MLMFSSGEPCENILLLLQLQGARGGSFGIVTRPRNGRL